MGKTLIAFYSRAGGNYANGEVVNLTVGNTEVAAEYLKGFVEEADMFKIEQVDKYPDDYMDCTAKAKMDQSTNARPELTKYLDSIDEYELIYLGYPNYWNTMPMAVFTFLEKYDFTGKVIKPFCTHEGSGMGVSEEDIKKLCPGATVKAGLPIHGADARGSKFQIKRWYNKED